MKNFCSTAFRKYVHIVQSLKAKQQRIEGINGWLPTVLLPSEDSIYPLLSCVGAKTALQDKQK